MYWWIYPSRLTLFVLLPIFLCCAWMSNDAFALYKHAANFISNSAFWLGLAGLLAFAGGAWFTEPRTIPQSYPSLIHPRALTKVLIILYTLTLSANILFLIPLFAHPQLLIELASGSKDAMFDLRDTLNLIPGVTSFVAFQSLCMLVHVGFERFSGVKAPRFLRPLFIATIIASVLRSFLWSERLALLELVMPIIVVHFSNPAVPQKRWINFAPLAGFIGLFILFSTGEYFRSWQLIKNASQFSFLEYVGARFAGYYATALNNGACFFQFQDTSYAPLNIAEWFYKLPLWPLLHVTFDNYSLFSEGSNDAFLGLRGNPEFNNPSGLYMPFFDFGPVLGLLIWYVLGLISGALLKGFAKGYSLGQILFPVWYIGALEILRIYYWGSSRFFPVFISACFIAFYLDKWKKRVPTNA